MDKRKCINICNLLDHIKLSQSNIKLISVKKIFYYSFTHIKDEKEKLSLNWLD